MTLISCCPLPNYIFTFKWALFIRIMAGTFRGTCTKSALYTCSSLQVFVDARDFCFILKHTSQYCNELCPFKCRSLLWKWAELNLRGVFSYFLFTFG